MEHLRYVWDDFMRVVITVGGFALALFVGICVWCWYDQSPRTRQDDDEG